MITLAEVQDIAEGWARRQSFRRGYPCVPEVDELTHGFAVGMRLPPEVRSEPGADLVTVVDRETGRSSHWPPMSLPALDRVYSERRGTVNGPHRTADPVVELRREAHRRVSPSVAAHITLGGRLFRTRGAKGDQEITHHPLVAGLLAEIPRPSRVRGDERHAELLVLSDVFTDADRTRAEAGQAPLNLDEARVLLSHGTFETFHIREENDSHGGRPTDMCATCWHVLVTLGVRSAEEETYRYHQLVKRQTSGDDAEPGRFPPEVAWELAVSGDVRVYNPERELRWAEGGSLEAPAERRLQAFAAAREAYVDFTDLTTKRLGPGLGQRVRMIRFSAHPGRYLAEALYEFGLAVGARMFPLGSEGLDEGFLAIDERGRVFALDQGGEWFIGETVDEAIVALLLGSPNARVRDDGTWRDEQ